MSITIAQKTAMFDFFQDNFKEIVSMFKEEFDVKIDDDSQPMVDDFQKEMGEKLNKLMDSTFKSSAEKIKKAKKAKKAKDPMAPKRGKSSYIFFCVDKRDDIKQNHPDLSAKQITSKLGEVWRGMSDEDKEPFVTLADEDKKRYTSAMDDFVPSVSSDSDKSSSSSTSSNKKKPTASKRSLNGYQLFCAKMRPIVKNDNPDMKFGPIGKLLGQMWASSSEQDIYKKQASELKDGKDSKAPGVEDPKEASNPKEASKVAKVKDAKKPKSKTTSE
jgi:hypothetical protein